MVVTQAGHAGRAGGDNSQVPSAKIPEHVVWSQQVPPLSLSDKCNKNLVVIAASDTSYSSSRIFSEHSSQSNDFLSLAARAAVAEAAGPGNMDFSGEGHQVWTSDRSASEKDSSPIFQSLAAAEGGEGSSQHDMGLCSPCFFANTRSGCQNGARCEFCHLPHKKKSKPKPCKKKRDQYRKLVTSKEEMVMDDPDDIARIMSDLPASVQADPKLTSKILSRLELAADTVRASRRQEEEDDEGEDEDEEDEKGLPLFGVSINAKDHRRKHIVSL